MNHESSTASCTHALVHNRLACDMRVLAVKREPTLILEPFLRRSLSQRLFRLVQSGTPSQQVAANNPSTSRSQCRTKQYLCTRPLPAAFGGAELELASACRTAPPRPSSCHTYLLIMHACESRQSGLCKTKKPLLFEPAFSCLISDETVFTGFAWTVQNDTPSSPSSNSHISSHYELASLHKLWSQASGRPPSAAVRSWNSLLTAERHLGRRHHHHESQGECGTDSYRSLAPKAHRPHPSARRMSRDQQQQPQRPQQPECAGPGLA